MVVIRLARGGSKKRPFYNIVVAEQKNRRDGRFRVPVPVACPVEQLSGFDPLRDYAEETEFDVAGA